MVRATGGRWLLIALGVAAGLRGEARAASASPEAEPGRFVTLRHAYYRGEQAELKFIAPWADAVEFDTSGWLPQTSPLGGCDRRDWTAVYIVDTRLLRAGDYLVRARVIRDGRRTEQACFPLTIAPPRDDRRLPVWRWGGAMRPRFWSRFGFTGGFAGSYREPLRSGAPSDELARALDEAVRCDFDFGLYLRPLDSPRLAKDESLRVLFPDGRRGEAVYPREPAALAWCRAMADSWIRACAPFPSLRHAMFHSEIRTPFCVSPTAVRLGREEAGVDVRRFVTQADRVAPPAPDDVRDGLVDDDNPRYRFLKWWWELGHGASVANAQMARAVKAVRPDVITWHEPYRLAPVRRSHQGLDMIGTWTYGHPDIKRLCYTTYLQAAARPERQLVQQNITLFVYGRFALPPDDPSGFVAESLQSPPFFTAGPDYAREAIWLVLSQRPDCLAFYSAGRLSPERPGLDPNVASPETFHAIRQTVDELVRPYGPLLRRSTRTPPQTALLMSAAGVWFGDAPRLPGYPNEQTLPVATLLMLNHVPFDVLLDDDVLEGALERYRVLVLSGAAALTRGVHRRIAEFAERGGTVIADKQLKAPIPNAHLVDLDFTYQNRVDGRYLADGRAVTAEEHQRRADAMADRLAPLLRGVERPAAAASRRVLVGSLDGGQARYHFFINDLRTYGPRFGRWKLRQELGAPQRAEVSVAIDDRPAIYDMLARRPIAYQTRRGRAVFELALPAARGKLVAALPEPIERVAIDGPDVVEPGERCELSVRVLGRSGRPLPAVLPLEVTVLDPLGRPSEWGGWFAAEQGRLDAALIPALNDPPGEWTVRVTDLISGATAEHRAMCRASARTAPEAPGSDD